MAASTHDVRMVGYSSQSTICNSVGVGPVSVLTNLRAEAGTCDCEWAMSVLPLPFPPYFGGQMSLEQVGMLLGRT